MKITLILHYWPEFLNWLRSKSRKVLRCGAVLVFRCVLGVSFMEHLVPFNHRLFRSFAANFCGSRLLRFVRDYNSIGPDGSHDEKLYFPTACAHLFYFRFVSEI